MQMEIVIKMIMAAVLLWLAIEDYRKKEIPIWQIILVYIVAIIGRLLLGIECFSQILGISIGLCMLAVSFLSKQRIGYGDSLILLALGFYLGAGKLLWMMMIASLVLSIISGWLLFRKKATMQSKLPYLPALFIGFCLV